MRSNVPRKHLEDYSFHLTFFFSSLLKTCRPDVAGCHLFCNEGKLLQHHNYGLKVCFHPLNTHATQAFSFFVSSLTIFIWCFSHCTACTDKHVEAWEDPV